MNKTMKKGMAVVVSLFGACTALVGSYLTTRGSLTASVVATIGAVIMCYGFSVLEKYDRSERGEA